LLFRYIYVPVNLLSIPDAAGVLGISPARVRALVVAGQLPAEKISNRWLLDAAAVERRQHEDPRRGRPFAPRNAWGLLLYASGEHPQGLEPSVRSRLKRALRQEGLERLRPRLKGRARVLSYRAHPGEIPYLLEDPLLVCSGISAAAEEGIGLVSGREADGYLAAGNLKAFAAEHALAPAARGEANACLRVVPDEAWSFLDGRVVAPQAAVAMDLSEEPDARSAQAGDDFLRQLDQAAGR
jgi:hypothetical protein